MEKFTSAVCAFNRFPSVGQMTRAKLDYRASYASLARLLFTCRGGPVDGPRLRLVSGGRLCYTRMRAHFYRASGNDCCMQMRVITWVYARCAAAKCFSLKCAHNGRRRARLLCTFCFLVVRDGVDEDWAFVAQFMDMNFDVDASSCVALK